MIASEDIQRARQADLVQYLIAQGYELRPEGEQYRLPDHGGLIIQRNHYYSFADEKGGNSLDFLTTVLGRPFPDAVRELTGFRPAPPRPAKEATSKEFVLPQRASDDHRVFAYLTQTRHIPGPLVAEVVKAGLLYQDQHGNCVFPCLDNDDQPRGAILRGTNTFHPYKGRSPGSDVSYGWYWPPAQPRSGALLVVEAPIDALSLASLGASPDPRMAHILTLGGLHRQAVDTFLARHPEVTHVGLALDNDKPGRTAAAEIRQALQLHGKTVFEFYPPHAAKDWNEELAWQRTNPNPRYYEHPQPTQEQEYDHDHDR